MKRLFIPAIAIILAIGSSAFTTTTTSNFFLYVGPAARTSADVQNINNYQASVTDPCTETQNVCGVTLTTAKTVGQTPASSEFNPLQSKLWQSQQQHNPQDLAIGMID